MTDQRTLKNIITKQRNQIAKAKEALDIFCDGCSKFDENTFTCMLKKSKSCSILNARSFLISSVCVDSTRDKK